MPRSTRSKSKRPVVPARTTAGAQPARETAAPPYAGVLDMQRSAGNQATTAALQSGHAGGNVPPQGRQVLHAPGEPLDPETRQAMEAQLGHDFSGVRVHSDAQAADSAAAVNAKAYTVGQDVVMGKGQYKPGSGAGDKLLAHELAHTIQQTRGGPPPPLNPHAAHEQDAHTVAAQVAAGQSNVTVTGATGTGMARQPLGQEEGFPELGFGEQAADDKLYWTFERLGSTQEHPSHHRRPEISPFAQEPKLKPVTENDLFNWAARRIKQGDDFRAVVAAVKGSHEFTGSDAARRRFVNFLGSYIEELQYLEYQRREEEARRRQEEIEREAAEKALREQQRQAIKSHKKGEKFPTSSEAFKGVEPYIKVEDNLPKEDTWIGYMSNENFTIGRTLRWDPEAGDYTTLYYAASVKIPGFKGAQWIIGPDTIDAFVASPDYFLQRSIFLPVDPDDISDWQREVFLAQQSAMEGDFGEAFGHIGQSHVEKWSDDPIGTVIELLPAPRAPGPKASVPHVKPPKVKPPKVKPPVKTPTPQAKTPTPPAKTATPSAKTPTPPAKTPTPPAKTATPPAKTPTPPAKAPPPKPKVIESAGAAPPGTKTMVDPFTGKEGQVVATSKTPRSQRTAIEASGAEFEAYNTAIHKRGEIGIQRPGNVNQGGPDYITAVRRADGKIEVIVADPTINAAKVPKTSVPPKWMDEVRDAVSTDRLKLGDPKLEAEIRDAVKQGRVRVRTEDVAKTPQGKVKIKER